MINWFKNLFKEEKWTVQHSIKIYITERYKFFDLVSQEKQVLLVIEQSDRGNRKAYFTDGFKRTRVDVVFAETYFKND